ncbi:MULTISPECIES: ClbS/DfsB family four-helix bundle protein [unclassified Enterococcus]|uniref:ClbS/DfsB family four-helix bundle protein n=1 Tax=unclassified Enterococcus TaxID=2608891 RepID=UPI001CE03923|nr:MULTISPECIES: ClbS/DfsB family four-helix bundle protein [unclassified Enterococcus]MCA5011556.1 ClbS/DfsB family four-helix bundle protein [Enterococcus sp. S23]MCA5015002.1 ClbS/DfsB family four-helix bundle protein [Enterococcus sp. S22(2020)]
MPRPTTKIDLITTADEQFSKLWQLIDSMSAEKQNASFIFSETFLEKRKEVHWQRDKNLRDVLIHLYEWHQLLLNWVDSNQNGEAKPFIPTPYNWRTYGKLNEEFIEKHQNTSLNEAKELLKNSHAEVLKMIETFTNEELFAKNTLPWTGTSTLGSYCVSATSSHYEWAIKKIKQHIKS